MMDDGFTQRPEIRFSSGGGKHELNESEGASTEQTTAWNLRLNYEYQTSCTGESRRDSSTQCRVQVEEIGSQTWSLS